jgi:hypothetical protein
MWRGHITLPSSFLSGIFVLQCLLFAYVFHLCFSEMQQLRDRLRALEQINAKLVQSIAPQLRGTIPLIPDETEAPKK